MSHYSKLLSSLTVFLMFGAGAMASTPDLTQACSKECPNATNNDEALRCAEKMERSQGEKAFKKMHRACYSAHEKYEKKSGKEEAGEEAAEEK